MHPVCTEIATALLFCSEYDATHCVVDIDSDQLTALKDAYYLWVDRCFEAGLIPEDLHIDELAPGRSVSTTDYIYSRLGAGAGLWEWPEIGTALHTEALKDGRLEGLIEGTDNKLLIV
mgnify:CR=1 FL=1